MEFDLEFALETVGPLLMAFLQVTLVVTVAGSVVAALLGLIWAVCQRELPTPVRLPLSWVLDVIRMTPLPLQLLFAVAIFISFDGYRKFPDTDVETIGMILGVAVFAIHYSTYMAESYRAGIDSIRQGQWEAATALSLPRSRVWRAVIIPQALRATLPSLGNWAIAMFKDTPFLLVILVPEMVAKAKQLGGASYQYTEVFTVAGLIFLAASYPTAVLMRKLEKKLVY
ncbi:polar amino acid transport system permease protein [Nocardioides luteus]|uniref:Ectoine/hydroxyectoine ABC transporter permease subunit EhuD n=1 Tax=Nocardioides luteus TaxID=1844 RepID=A0ABQ5T2V7_9ACTN|nr:ABC transporter permease subunit [Nocardioides luteus]MDR7309618.1 polar amino acid transport system permease protein [Nocardioides luteus]GGR52363.1 ectoine/hydroxyectoine ABC transporter permease subunit EhuD [Nocardioides luteus]GLJ70599.1 ectoine/hydroxyectoine ABC transporter permease subunit EhuD [Nocardioides luteus]